MRISWESAGSKQWSYCLEIKDLVYSTPKITWTTLRFWNSKGFLPFTYLRQVRSKLLLRIWYENFLIVPLNILFFQKSLCSKFLCIKLPKPEVETEGWRQIINFKICIYLYCWLWTNCWIGSNVFQNYFYHF